jgi:DNA-binding XRE family transcriptional regulator
MSVGKQKRTKEKAQSERLSGKTSKGNPLVRTPLKEIREDIGMSQAQLAKAAGIPSAAIANVELGRYALSANLGVSIYTALAQAALPGSALRREAKEEAERLAAFQEDISRKVLIAIEGEFESLEKKREKHARIQAEIEKKKARLREL